MKWTDVIGQERVKERLKEMVRTDRVPHAVMLAGDTGNGTLALAMALASAMLCSGRKDDGGMFADESAPVSADPCGVCPQCKMLRQWHHPDLFFSFPTVKQPSWSSDHRPVSDDYMSEWFDMVNGTNGDVDPSNPVGYYSMDEWMQAMKATTQQAIITAAESDDLARKIALKSSQGGYKVAIIWLAERMNEESANKILKTLEEPTEKTVFILVCERPERLLDTIRSRVQRIDVPKIAAADLQQALMDRRGLDESTAMKLARASGGNWLKAVEMLQPDSEYHEFLDKFIQLMRLVYARDVRGMKKWSETVGDSKYGREKQKRMLIYFMRMIREAFMSNFRNQELSYMTDEEEQFVSKFGRFVNEANVIDINALLELALRDISQNTNQRIVFFDTALRLTALLLRK